MDTVEGNNQTTFISSIESLRLILEHEQARPVSYDEAVDVGDSLITFYETLSQQEGAVL